MPYIPKSRRAEIDLLGTVASDYVPGDLNYQFTLLILDYIDARGLSYQTINDIVGSLECCKQEFYRRVAGPYENKKSKDNGDVY